MKLQIEFPVMQQIERDQPKTLKLSSFFPKTLKHLIKVLKFFKFFVCSKLSS